jgi:hypothetical protein
VIKKQSYGKGNCTYPTPVKLWRSYCTRSSIATLTVLFCMANGAQYCVSNRDCTCQSWDLKIAVQSSHSGTYNHIVNEQYFCVRSYFSLRSPREIFKKTHTRRSSANDSIEEETPTTFTRRYSDPIIPSPSPEDACSLPSIEEEEVLVSPTPPAFTIESMEITPRRALRLAPLSPILSVHSGKSSKVVCQFRAIKNVIKNIYTLNWLLIF